LKDDDFIVQKFVSGLCCSPTTMAFIGNDILVLHKNSGQVSLIRDGVQRTVLDENVTSEGEQGMLGIATVGNKVYLYFTESTRDGGPPLGKRVYSYDWTGQELVNRTLIRDFPQTQRYHNGGDMTVGLDGTVYLVLGDAGRYGKLQNKPVGEPDDTSVILPIAPLGPYYAVGVRNSFGITADPITGKLWDTENGDDNFDEINLVERNFNSGWIAIMGPASESQLAELRGYPGYAYSDPEFSWEQVVAPTGLTFIDSEPFERYRNSLFVVDFIYGNLYRFELNENRDGFAFNSPELLDNVVNTDESMDEIIFGTGFRGATDIVAGPDGLLYIVSISDGTIYRILPKTMATSDITDTDSTYIQYIVYVVIAAIAIASAIYLRKRSMIARTG
jgi:glucose/arabinose dehydrogenase